MPTETPFVPLPCPASEIKATTHIRGSVLFASLRALRARDLHERYLQALPPEFHAPILGIVATAWTPIAPDRRQRRASPTGSRGSSSRDLLQPV